jgi:hypothetical protein
MYFPDEGVDGRTIAPSGRRGKVTMNISVIGLLRHYRKVAIVTGRGVFKPCSSCMTPVHESLSYCPHCIRNELLNRGVPSALLVDFRDRVSAGDEKGVAGIEHLIDSSFSN